MNDIILIMAIGIIAILVIQAIVLFEKRVFEKISILIELSLTILTLEARRKRDLKSIHNDVRKTRESLFWSARREKKLLELIKK